MNPEQMLYLVVSAHERGDYLPERNVADLDRRATVRDIRDGQLGDVVHVIEFCIAEKIIADVTEDVLCEVGRDSPPPTKQDRIDWERDHERSARNEEAGQSHQRGR